MTKVADILTTMEYGPAPESAKLANQWLDAHSRAFGMYIGGQWTTPTPDRMIDVINPSTAKRIAAISHGTADNVDAAVAAARKAFKSWSQMPGHARAKLMYGLARKIQKHARLLAVLETMDNGKPIRETRDIDIPLVARHFYHHAGWAQVMDTELPGYTPVGVVGQVVPWNFPLLMLAWKIAPAIAAGNTIVLKPSKWTSLSALAFAELCDDAGIPPGVVNIITGDGGTGDILLQHPGIDKIAFTGSTEVGRHIRNVTAGSGKKLSLELGGKSPFIVFEDADLDSAIEGIVDAIWFNQGQVCCAGSRLLVQEGIAEELYRRLRARMEKLRVGDPLDKAVDIGAIVAKAQLVEIETLVRQGQAEGAILWQPSWACPTEGFFYPPTLFTEVAPSATIAQVEIFGPVLVAMTFRTPAEAIALANNTRYGLAASVWSEDINLALDISGKIKAGVVWINSTNVFDAAAGFGGYRESGYGREGGREGMFEYLKPRGLYSEGAPALVPAASGANSRAVLAGVARLNSAIDRTPKNYIGGRQARPDSGYSRAVRGSSGELIGEVGDGNRKDIRNAVEAARAASGWAEQTAHNRAQVVYYIAENLAARRVDFAARLSQSTGVDAGDALAEVDASIDRLFTFAAWSDKYDGAVHRTPYRAITLAFNEPMGVIGVVCPDERPLLSLVTLMAGAIAMGNAIVVVPSEAHPLLATDLYQVLDTSDVPGGVVNLVTGPRADLANVLAAHMDIDAVWCFATPELVTLTERASIGNMKRMWTSSKRLHWESGDAGLIQEILRQSTQVKNVWAPYGA